jgi:hypothetical protein
MDKEVSMNEVGETVTDNEIEKEVPKIEQIMKSEEDEMLPNYEEVFSIFKFYFILNFKINIFNF